MRQWLFYLLLLIPAFGHAEITLLKSEIITPPWTAYDAHSPTLLELSDHSLLAGWLGGFGEGKCDYPQFANKVGIWITRSEKQGWSTPELITVYEHTKCWNPVLHRLPTGEILLFYKVGDNPRSWYGVFKRSHDEGKTWSAEELLPAGILGPIKNKVLIGSDGALICGSSVESGDLANPFKATACWVEVASPGLDKWKKQGPLALPHHPFGALQPTLYFGENGSLHLLCRDRGHRVDRLGYIWHAVSNDQGQTWSPLVSTGLPNPDSGIDTLKYGQKVLLFYNPSHQERSPLTLALSLDEGEHWTPVVEIDRDRAEYPYVIATEDHLVHLVYSYSALQESQRKIKHVILAIDD